MCSPVYHLSVNFKAKPDLLVVRLSRMISDECLPFFLPRGITPVLQMSWHGAVPAGKKKKKLYRLNELL